MVARGFRSSIPNISIHSNDKQHAHEAKKNPKIDDDKLLIFSLARTNNTLLITLNSLMSFY